MKCIALSLLVLAGLAGCGSLAPLGAQSAATTEVDSARVNAINSAARIQGVEVVWINLPTRAVKAAGN